MISIVPGVAWTVCCHCSVQMNVVSFVIHFLGLTLSEGVVPLSPKVQAVADCPHSIWAKKSSALVNTVLLTHPAPQAAIALATDASDMAVWAVLEHHVAGAWQPLTFVLVSMWQCSISSSCLRAALSPPASSINRGSLLCLRWARLCWWATLGSRFPAAISEIIADIQQVVANASAASCWLQVYLLKLYVLIWNLLWTVFFLNYASLQLWMRGSVAGWSSLQRGTGSCSSGPLWVFWWNY